MILGVAVLLDTFPVRLLFAAGVPAARRSGGPVDAPWLNRTLPDVCFGHGD